MGFGGTRNALGAATFVACMVGLSADAHAQGRPPAKPTKEAAKPSSPSPARARATELYKKSADAYLHGDFAQAIALLDEAYALDPQPVLIYNKARAHEGLGHLDEAIDLYEKYLAQEPSSSDRGAIEQRLVTLRHQRDERSALEKERAVVVTERAAVEKERAALPAEPPPEPPRRRSVLPYVVMGAGGVGLLGGTIFGLMALSRKNAATAEPVQQTSIDERDKGRTFAVASNVSFITGGILVAAGAAWWVVDGRSMKRRGSSLPPVQVGLGLGYVQLGGAFQ